MADNEWHSGPPPSRGWWPASVFRFRDPEMLGWFDGATWSEFAWIGDGKKEAARRASKRGAHQEVEWQHRPASWPKRSRT